MILLCGGLKGGIGKSTIATNFAVMRSKQLGSGKVALIDADPQESSYKFTQLRNEALDGNAGYNCFKITGKPVRSEALGLAAKYEDVIIDAGVGDSTGQRAALTVAHVAVLPFRPGSYDLWTAGDLASLIDEMRDVNPGLVALAFINQGDHQGQDNSGAIEILRESEGITVLDCPLGYRKAFRNIALGRAVTELSPADPKAIAEMTAIYAASFGDSGVTDKITTESHGHHSDSQRRSR